MILDRMEAADLYSRLGDRFAAGFRYLRTTDLAALPDGRHEIGGRELIAVVQTYTTKPPEHGRWEAHRHHADIQYVVRGTERMGVVPAGALQLLPPYDPDKDVEFYGGPLWVGQSFIVTAGSFALFLPNDLHMPGLIAGNAAEVKKVVVKVRLE